MCYLWITVDWGGVQSYSNLYADFYPCGGIPPSHRANGARQTTRTVYILGAIRRFLTRATRRGEKPDGGPIIPMGPKREVYIHGLLARHDLIVLDITDADILRLAHDKEDNRRDGPT